MTIIIMNILITLINSFIDFYLINLLFKALYIIHDEHCSNQIFCFLEFILLIIANYLQFKYIFIKIILLGIVFVIHSKKYHIQIDYKFFFIICYICLKYPFEQLLSYALEYIFNTRMINSQMYFALLRRIILEIIIRYCEYTCLIMLNIYYHNFEIHFKHFKIMSILVSASCGIILIFTTDSLFYFQNVGRTFLFIVVLYFITLILFIYIDRKHQIKVLGMQKINQNIIFEIEKLKGKDETEKEIRTIKHNLHNDYTILDGYLCTAQYKKAQDFIRDRVKNLKEVTHETHTGNIAIDSIIEQKKVIMEKYNIEYQEMITSCYIGNIGDYEIALLIGLALDNAIEATCQAGEHKIITFMSQNEAGHLIIQIDNPIIQGVQPHFDKTSKQKDQKNHGLGIRKMKEIVKRYEGELRYKTVNDMVSLTFLLQTNLKQKS